MESLEQQVDALYERNDPIAFEIMSRISELAREVGRIAVEGTA